MPTSRLAATDRVRSEAAGNEGDALAALDADGADLYALAQPDVPGGQTTREPNTVIWGYASTAIGAKAKAGTTNMADPNTYNNALPDATQATPPPQP